MKTYAKVTLLFILSFFLLHPVQGQNLLNRLKQKAQEKVEQKIEERAEEKMDEKIDESLDKIEDSLEKDNEEISDESDSDNQNRAENRMQGLMQSMGMSGEPVPIEDNYSFDYKIQMHIESYDKNGKQESTGEFITHLNPKNNSMAYEFVSGDMAQEGQGLFIIDAENDAMIILNDEDDEKTGMVYGMGSFMQSIGESYSDEELEDTPEMYLANPNVKKTGKTKNIAGYKCEEYVYTDEENKTKSNIWITKDLKMNTQDFFSTIFKTSLYSHGMGWGYMMEATTENLENGEKTIMQITDVDDNSNISFSMDNYQITNLGSFTMPATD